MMLMIMGLVINGAENKMMLTTNGGDNNRIDNLGC